jgi:hypothetical protein
MSFDRRPVSDMRLRDASGYCPGFGE